MRDKRFKVDRLDMVLGKLATMPLAELRKMWDSVGAGEVPTVPADLLRRLVAQRMQEKRHGGLPRLVARELERAARDAGPAAASRASQPVGPGTRLIREWNGRTITVKVRDDGYVWEERLYSSLSKIACEVTGAKWSGPRFFGLTRNG